MTGPDDAGRDSRRDRRDLSKGRTRMRMSLGTGRGGRKVRTLARLPRVAGGGDPGRPARGSVRVLYQRRVVLRPRSRCRARGSRALGRVGNGGGRRCSASCPRADGAHRRRPGPRLCTRLAGRRRDRGPAQPLSQPVGTRTGTNRSRHLHRDGRPRCRHITLAHIAPRRRRCLGHSDPPVAPHSGTGNRCIAGRRGCRDKRHGLILESRAFYR